MDRKREILKLIKEGEQNTKKLAERFGVSLMSIYRDLKELEKEGLIVRKYGKLEVASRSVKESQEKQKDICAFCHKENDDRLRFTFYLETGKQIHTCCPHCGLLLYKSILDP
ncbi:MAG TPA: DeoR/GlpR transcriptional regulator, partial [Hydrogenobaculum sp.]|nr:DeoR/GlpR transcriptional regulator [Hydrogenobaculum sp.]